MKNVERGNSVSCRINSLIDCEQSVISHLSRSRSRAELAHKSNSKFFWSAKRELEIFYVFGVAKRAREKRRTLRKSRREHNFTYSLAARCSEERRAICRGLFASSFLIVSPSKRDSTLVRAFLFSYFLRWVCLNSLLIKKITRA